MHSIKIKIERLLRWCSTATISGIYAYCSFFSNNTNIFIALKFSVTDKEWESEVSVSCFTCKVADVLSKDSVRSRDVLELARTISKRDW